MRRYLQRFGGTLDRTIKTYEKVRWKDRGEKEDDQVRKTPLRSPVPDFALWSKRGGAPGTQAAAGPAGSSSVDARPDMPEGDIGWALEIDPVDVAACGGYLPERCLDGQPPEDDGPDGESDSGVAVPVDEQVPAGCEGGVNVEGERGGDVVDEGDDDVRQEAVAAHGDLGLDNNVTNEPNLPAERADAQQQANLEVTANLGVDAGLDKVENEPISDGPPRGAGGAGFHDGEALAVGRLPTQNLARAPAAAATGSQREKKKKKKRVERAERKVLARRELERRLRAHLERGGTVAEANKLIDDLQEAARQAFGDLFSPGARGP
jgi:hypothetical protein